MTTYSSDKAVPYVYICTHKETNQFYIGYRERNVKLNRPSHLDLPEYKTSSKIINPDFHDYTWFILAEFFDPSHAYIFEQQMIFDNWENPLLLNGHCVKDGHMQFRSSGPQSPEHIKKRADARRGKPGSLKGKSQSPEHIKNSADARTGKSSSLKGKSQSPEHIKKRADANRGKKVGPQSPEHIKKRADSNRGKTRSDAIKQKLHDAQIGRSQREVVCPHCGKVGGVSNMTRYHFDNCKKKPQQ
jgi:hypothetical protein